RSDQERNRGAQGRQIRPGSGKKGGPGAARGGAQERQAHSVQGKHRAGAKVLRPTRAAHAGAGFGAETCGLEIVLLAKRLRPPRARFPNSFVIFQLIWLVPATLVGNLIFSLFNFLTGERKG